jgi:hypothetical protein
MLYKERKKLDQVGLQTLAVMSDDFSDRVQEQLLVVCI